MNVREQIRATALDTLYDPELIEDGFRDTFSENLRLNAELLEEPGDHPIDTLGYALMAPELAPAERQAYAAQAMEGIRDRLIGGAAILGFVDNDEATQKAQELSANIVQHTADLAESYPKKGSAEGVLADMTTIMDSTSDGTTESRVVAACVAFDFAKPYIAKRLSELEVFDVPACTEQLRECKADMQLMQKFIASTANAIEFSLKGETTITTEEIAERLFGMGPIFAKMGQSLTGMAKNADGPRASFVRSIGRSLQEGIALPPAEQETELTNNLPEDLTYDGAISSASIAYILKVSDGEGLTSAYKVKRPGIEEALHDNERTYVVASDILREYLLTNLEGNQGANKLAQMQEALPFMLQVIRRDIEGELDFTKEASIQARAAEAFREERGVHVPEIKSATAEGIEMAIVPGVRIEEAPANPAHLSNLVRMVKQLWKAGLIHGDMHAGNIKATADGSGDIVAYDWGRTIERAPRMISNLGLFLWSVARKNPDAMAKRYVAIQSPHHEQIAVEDARKTAEDVIASWSPSIEPRSWSQKKMLQTNGVMQSFLITLGIRHQTALDGDYLALMKSSAALGTIAQDELSKPYYQSPKTKIAAFASMAKAAIRK